MLICLLLAIGAGDTVTSPTFDVLCGDAYETLCALPSNIVQCVVTSPPYWFLRDYKVEGQLGLEPLHEYLAKMAQVFDEVRRVLRPDGTLWLNLGDSSIGSGKGATGGNSTITNPRRYEESGFPIARTRQTVGLKDKDLVGVPWRVALELQRRGWWLRSDIIWHKPNGLPEPVEDRPGRAHEHIFLLSKSEQYFYDHHATRVPSSDRSHPRGRVESPAPTLPGLKLKAKPQLTGWRASKRTMPANAKYGPEAKPRRRTISEDERLRIGKSNESFQSAVRGLVDFVNLRDVWTIATVPSMEDHYAMFPPEIPRRCITASTKPGDLVLDPFSGMATTGLVALELARSYLGIELDEKAAARSRERARQVTPAHPALLADFAVTGRVA